MRLLRFAGEQEFTARTAGLSSIILFSTMIPLLLLIIIISYRYIKRRNLEIEAAEEEIRFAELEAQRQKIYSKMYDEHHQKEIEIAAHLEKLEAENPALTEVVQIDHHGDSTDDEFFEMPLPPVPAVGTSSPTSGQVSITDNEELPSITPSTSKVEDTPKVDNAGFRFPPQPTRPAPLPPLHIPKPQPTRAAPAPPKKYFDPTSLPPVPPRPSSASTQTTPPADERDSVPPVIIDLTPKSLLQSDF